MDLESVEQLQELHQRYPMLDAITLAEDGSGLTMTRHDSNGNQLTITVQKFAKIQYQETSFAETRELYWDEESATYKHRKRQ